MEEVAKEAKAAGKPIRIRISPGLYRGDRRYYTAWHTLTWFLTFPGVEEARRFRVVFQKFFEIMATEGPEETQRRLEGA
jgi:hypothetical protein